jgi:uncharacterized membrane protein
MSASGKFCLSSLVLRPKRSNVKGELRVSMKERWIPKSVDAGTLLQGLQGAAECIGGLILTLISAPALIHLAGALTQTELAQHPHDVIATRLMLWINHFSTGNKILFAIYLLGHGLARIVLAVALVRDRRGIYPAPVTLRGLFY